MKIDEAREWIEAFLEFARERRTTALCTVFYEYEILDDKARAKLIEDFLYDSERSGPIPEPEEG